MRPRSHNSHLSVSFNSRAIATACLSGMKAPRRREPEFWAVLQPGPITLVTCLKDQGTGMGEDPFENMKARAEQCRRLADLTHDRNMAEQLRTWAAAIEQDIHRLQARLENIARN